MERCTGYLAGGQRCTLRHGHAGRHHVMPGTACLVNGMPGYWDTGKRTDDGLIVVFCDHGARGTLWADPATVTY